MKKKVSLKDVAQKVGVSTATVSYVLSKGKDSRVSAAVSEKVRTVAQELGYQPNQIAKSLKMGKTFTIGLIVADISNPFFSHIARIIEDEAAKRNYTVIFGSSDESFTKSRDLIQFLSSRQVDGFIIAPSENSEEQITHLKNQNIPYVLIDRYFPGIQSNFVVIDNFEAAYRAVERLIQTGNKRIGAISYSNTLSHMRDRVRGFKMAMKDHHLTIKENWHHNIDFSEIHDGVKRALDSMLIGEDPVTAIFFATNTLAIHGLKYLDVLGYTVGQDLAIVSFDEGEAFDFYYCPLTYVKQPLGKLAENAVRILTTQIEKELELEQVCLEAELVIRKSCKRQNLT